MHKPPAFLDKCFKDKEGKVVLWQNPNVPLWVWLAASIASNLFMAGKPHRLFETLALGALFTWAYLEAASGVNYFRRALGIVVLLLIIMSRLK